MKFNITDSAQVPEEFNITDGAQVPVEYNITDVHKLEQNLI